MGRWWSLVVVISDFGWQCEILWCRGGGGGPPGWFIMRVVTRTYLECWQRARYVEENWSRTAENDEVCISRYLCQTLWLYIQFVFFIDVIGVKWIEERVVWLSVDTTCHTMMMVDVTSRGVVLSLYLRAPEVMSTHTLKQMTDVRGKKSV